MNADWVETQGQFDIVDKLGWLVGLIAADSSRLGVKMLTTLPAAGTV